MSIFSISNQIKSLIKKRSAIPHQQLLDEFLTIIKKPCGAEFPLEVYLNALADYGVRPIPELPNQGICLQLIDDIVEQLINNGLRKQLLLSQRFFAEVLELAANSDGQVDTFCVEVINNMASGQIERRRALIKNQDQNVRKLVHKIFQMGDYEKQIVVLEFLIRFQGLGDPKPYISLFGNKYLADQFSGFRKSEFESDARPFLNKINANNSFIVSLPCENAFVASREIKKPPAPGYKSLWIDFQYGSKSIRVYCMKHQTLGQDGKWDSLLIEAADILSYKVTKGATTTLIMSLAREGYLMFDASCLTQFPGYIVKMEFQPNLLGAVQQSIAKLCPSLSRSIVESESDDSSAVASSLTRQVSLSKSAGLVMRRKTPNRMRNVKVAPPAPVSSQGQRRKKTESIAASSSQCSQDVIANSPEPTQAAINQFKCAMWKKTPDKRRKHLPVSYKPVEDKPEQRPKGAVNENTVRSVAQSESDGS